MRVTLPVSEAWVEVREQFKGSDARKVRGAVSITVSEDGSRTLPGDIDILMNDAFLAAAITEWGGPGLEGIPTPALNMAGPDVIGEVLDSRDYAHLHREIQPLMAQVLGRPNPQSGNGRSPS
jgi:hypothetical protein